MTSPASKRQFSDGLLARISAILETEPPSLLTRRADIPLPLESVLRRALAKNREERYQSMKELLADMKGIREAAPMQSKVTKMPAGFRNWISTALLRALRK